MKRYGLLIGQVGVEFPSLEECQKAVVTFTKGVDIQVSNKGLRYTPGNGSFSVYQREDKEVLTNCEVCKGIFTTEVCTYREYPDKRSYSQEFFLEKGYICDACFAKKIKDKELADAKALVNKAEGAQE